MSPSSSASDLQIRLDMAQLIAELALYVGPDRSASLTLEQASPHELVRRRQALFEPLEQRNGLIGTALFGQSLRLEQGVLRRCRAGSPTQEIGWLHAEHSGDVLESFHRRTRASRLEHGDIGLRVLRFGELRLRHSLRRTKRSDTRADIRDHC